MVVANKYEVDVVWDAADATSLSFTFSLDVTDLVVDEPVHQKRWQQRFWDLGLLAKDEEFSEVDKGDRKKITEAMLSTKQLDIAKHKKITAEAVKVEAVNEQGLPTSLAVDIEIHGVKRQVVVPVHVALTSDTLKAESWIPLKFTDFGIKPYSAAFGAVKNKDQFHLFVYIEAVMAGEDVP